MAIRYVRVLRTGSSERFLLQDNNEDVGAIDLHYLADHSVAATLIFLTESNIGDDQVSSIIEDIDALLLPDVSKEQGNLVFTVIRGEVIGSFVPKT
jgi:hypothetical protein